MFLRGTGFSILAAMTVLLVSVGVDLRTALSLKSSVTKDLSAKPGYVPIGPRRYPPGYRAAAFIAPGNPSAGHASHQTVIKN